MWLLIGVMFCVERLRKRVPLTIIARDGLAVYRFFTGEVAGFENGSPRYFTAEDERRIAAHFEQARKENPEDVAAIEKNMAAYAARRPERHPLRFWECFTKRKNYNVADPALSPNYLFLCVPLLLLARRSRWVTWLLVISSGFFLLTVRTVWVAHTCSRSTPRSRSSPLTRSKTSPSASGNTSAMRGSSPPFLCQALSFAKTRFICVFNNFACLSPNQKFRDQNFILA